MGRSNELEGLKTLPELLHSSIEKNQNSEALREFSRSEGVWKSWTYRELGAKVLDWRRALSKIGLQKGERVAILLPNGVDHVCADQAALANGLVPVPLHAIDTPGACAFIIGDSGASALITNRAARWLQIEKTGAAMPSLRTVLLTEPDEALPEGGRRIERTDRLIAPAEPGTGLPEGPSEDDLACIVYTSGTTGRPKGVMLTHRNIVSNVRDTLECVSPRPGDVFLSFLPLSHTFERTAGYYLALATGCVIVYNRSVLLLAEDLKTVRPDVIISVPRVYERIHARIEAKLKKSGALSRRLFHLAVETGWRDFCVKNAITAPSAPRPWFDGLVRSLLLKRISGMLAAQFGGRLRIAISGGAALNPAVARTFCGLGLPIIQGYGMTEASPIIAGNRVEINQPDTVGRPFGHVEVRLGENNEIELRGPSIMKGYWKAPEETARALSEDGWLSTGDVGEWTEQGFLKIRGRIKEIIVTSTGEKIPPADLESAIETDPLFAQAYVVGENRPYLALIAVVGEAPWRELARAEGLDPSDPSSLANAQVRAAALKRAKLAARDFPHYALPRTVILTADPWTVENGLLTPTLKLKRGPLAKRFADEIAKLYSVHG